MYRDESKTEQYWPNPIIIVEGLLIFYYEQLRNKLDLKIFIDTDDDIRLSRRSKNRFQLNLLNSHKRLY